MFDGKLIEAFIPGDEGLRQLSSLLRHVEEWPQYFDWDYGKLLQFHDCGSAGCAIGLCAQIWPEEFPKIECTPGQYMVLERIISKNFGMPHCETERIFYAPSIGGGMYGKNRWDITPIDVANAIDDYLRRK